jgi:hypothetical protein
MPDQAPQVPADSDPPPRRTAMQTAQDAQATADAALELAQQLDQTVDNFAEKVTDIGQRLTDALTDENHPTPGEAVQTIADDVARLNGEQETLRSQVALLEERIQDRESAHAELRDEMQGRLSGARGSDAPSLDRVITLVAHGMQPLREEVGAFQGAITRKLDDLRTRLTKIEEIQRAQESSPAADALAEDAQADLLEEQVQRMVRERLDGILARLEAVESRSTASDGTPGMTWDAIAERVDNQAKIALAKHVATVMPAGAPGAAAKPRGIQAKVLELMRQVEVLGKNRETDSGPRYSFRSIDDAMDAVGRAVREIGIICSPDVLSESYDHHEARNNSGTVVLWTTARVRVRYTLTDPVDGSTHTFTMQGEGRDNSDKATSKAASMALKYALMQGLLIPVNGLPDADADRPQVTRPAAPPTTSAPAEQQEQPDRAALAKRAMDAVANIHRWPADQRHAKLVEIGHQLNRMSLLDHVVEHKGERAPLRQWILAQLKTLATPAPTPVSDEPWPHADAPPPDGLGDEDRDPGAPQYY